jgi:hypothetical protein
MRGLCVVDNSGCTDVFVYCLLLYIIYMLVRSVETVEALNFFVFIRYLKRLNRFEDPLKRFDKTFTICPF